MFCIPSPSRTLKKIRRRVRRLFRHRPKAASAVSLQEVYLPVDAIGLHTLTLDGKSGLRATWRVWGIDLYQRAPAAQAEWLHTYALFLRSTEGWQAQWRGSTQRNRMEEHLDRAEAILAHGDFSPELEAIARERLDTRREFAQRAFLTSPTFYFVVPADHDDHEALEARVDEVEGWFDQLRLPYRRLNLFDTSRLLAQDYGVEPPAPGDLLPYLVRPLSLGVENDDPVAALTVDDRGALSAALGLPALPPPGVPA